MAMNHDVIISCAVTGDDTKVTKSPHCAITPEQIAATAIEAAQAGAAIVHIHVRNPETGALQHGDQVLPRGGQAHPRKQGRCDRESHLRHGRLHRHRRARAEGHAGAGQRFRDPGRAHAAHHRSVPRGQVPSRHRDPRLREPELRRRQSRLHLDAELSAPGRRDRPRSEGQAGARGVRHRQSCGSSSR